MIASSLGFSSISFAKTLLPIETSKISSLLNLKECVAFENSSKKPFSIFCFDCSIISFAFDTSSSTFWQSFTILFWISSGGSGINKSS